MWLRWLSLRMSGFRIRSVSYGRHAFSTCYAGSQNLTFCQRAVRYGSALDLFPHIGNLNNFFALDNAKILKRDGRGCLQACV